MTIEKKENHKTLIVQITEILPIKDAEKVELVKFGLPYQCVSQKGTFKVGDLAVYVQPDSVVPTTEPFKFIWEPYVQPDATVPEKRRRITVRKMRGEWSEGLLLPVNDFPELITDEFGTLPDATGEPICFYLIGDDVSDVLGVTHYQPAEDEGNAGFQPVRKPRRPKTLKGWFLYTLRRLFGKTPKQAPKGEQLDYPKYDVDGLKSQTFNPFVGQEVVITEKVHGSSARYVYLDGKMYAGSRNLWLAPESSGYATAALNKNPQIETWCREHEGFALYGEVTPTQKNYEYGLKDHQFHLFDIRHPDGYWLDYEDPLYFTAFAAGIRNVPVILKCAFDDITPSMWKDITEGTYSHVVAENIAKKTYNGKTNIREGVVIKTVKEQLGRRRQYKVVNNTFLDKDNK